METGKHGKYTKFPRIYLPNLYSQFVCPSPKVLDFNEKRLHCASVVSVFTTLAMYFAILNQGMFLEN